MVLSTTIETHKASEYVRDDRVNRFLSPARVAKLRATLNLDGIGVFIVSKRANGDLIILDGGHRATALMEEDMGDLEVPAVVHHDLSEEQEAKIFLLHNSQLAVTLLERFRIQVTAGDPESVILDGIIRKAGFVPASNSPSNGLSCIGSIQAVYRGGTSTGGEAHKATVEETLRIIAEAWGHESSAIKETVKGIGGLLLNHEDIDVDHLIVALSGVRTGPIAIRNRALYHTREGGLNARVGAEKSIADVYGKDLSPQKRIKV